VQQYDWFELELFSLRGKIKLAENYILQGGQDEKERHVHNTVVRNIESPKLQTISKSCVPLMYFCLKHNLNQLKRPLMDKRRELM
jgi:hypothetical protein